MLRCSRHLYASTGGSVPTKSVRLTTEEAEELRAYVALTGEVEAVALKRAALRGLRTFREEQGILAYLQGRESGDGAVIAGLRRARFLDLLMEHGITLVDGLPSVYEELADLAETLGDDRLQVASHTAIDRGGLSPAAGGPGDVILGGGLPGGGGCQPFRSLYAGGAARGGGGAAGRETNLPAREYPYATPTRGRRMTGCSAQSDNGAIHSVRMQFRTTVALGGKTATGISVPPEVVAALGPGKRLPVRVTIGSHTYRSTVAPYGGEFMIALSAENRESAGVAAGDEVEVNIELDTEPREVTVPRDFADALDGDAAARQSFDGLSYSNKRRHVLSIEDAKTPETRQRRIDKAVGMLREGRT